MTLKSVDEHNKEVIENRQKAEEAARKTGVACPNCKEELLWVQTQGWAALRSYFENCTRQAYCHKCNIYVNLQA